MIFSQSYRIDLNRSDTATHCIPDVYTSDNAGGLPKPGIVAGSTGAIQAQFQGTPNSVLRAVVEITLATGGEELKFRCD